jgi:hypothetical protein
MHEIYLLSYLCYFFLIYLLIAQDFPYNENKILNFLGNLDKGILRISSNNSIPIASVWWKYDSLNIQFILIKSLIMLNYSSFLDSTINFSKFLWE